MRRTRAHFYAGGPGLVKFTPAALFAGGVAGAFYDPSDLATLFQSGTRAAPGPAVAADGDPVGLMLDKSGNNNDLVQATAGSRPLYKTAAGLSWLLFDGVDDMLTVALAAGMAQPSSMGMAARLTSAIATGDMVDTGNTGDPATRNLMGARGSQFCIYAGAVLAGAAVDTNDHVQTGIFNGASSSIQTDAGAITQGDAGTGGPGAAGALSLASAGSPASEFAPMRCYAFVYAHKAVSASERAGLRTWLGAKAGLALS